jgi:RNA polymerase sigma factor (sigma-70 family)
MTTKSPPDPATFVASDAKPHGEGPDPLQALVRDAAAGQREALVRLMSLVAPPVTAAVRVLLGAKHPELDDAVQEALLAIAASLERFRGESSFLHYARRIAVRTALGLRRARDDAAHKLAEASASELPASAWQPDTLPAERDKRLELLLALLDELPDGQAECLAYRVLLEYPLPQIAREIGVPINTVRSRVRLARNHLRDRILADPTLAETLLLETDARTSAKEGT